MNPVVGAWGYALLCVALPALWGLLVVGITRLLEKRLQATIPDADDPEARGPAPDYHI